MNSRIDDFQAPKMAPVIIIGMHRSGTSFLARALSQCGLFLGKDLEGNHESLLFMLANNNIFAHCHATWNRPFSVHLALQNEGLANVLARSAVKFIESHETRYLGTDSGGLENFADIDFPWGWKDPRNTFTLPVWNRIFPGLKVIHILRHGVDVASSLYRREQVAREREAQRGYYPALRVVRDQFGLYYARFCRSIEQAFLLWEEYVEEAVQQVETYGDKALQLKYEDLLHDPETNLKNILAFCGLETHSIPPALLDTADAHRAYSYRQQPQLVEFAERWSETLNRYGY